MKIPFVDLKSQYEPIKEEINQSINKVINNCAFVGGEEIEKFEEQFATYCDRKYCVALSSGTDALLFALKACGIAEKDEVITVPNTFIATVEAISHAHAKPVFIDVDENNYNMDVDLIEQVITPRTKVIMPVHLYGSCADMDIVNAIARKHNIFVIEDSCQAHGSRYKGKKAGSLGDIGCFSFYPSKNLAAFGDCGAVVTDNKDIYKKIKMLRDHDQLKKNYHTFRGYNGRMDTIQAAVLLVNLKYLDYWNEKRRKFAGIYNEHLSGIKKIIIPEEAPWSRSNYHLYVIRFLSQHKNRDQLREELSQRGIATGIHYPLPIHFQKAYKYLGYPKGSFPVCEKYSEQILSLPMNPCLTKRKINQVCDAIKDILNE